MSQKSCHYKNVTYVWKFEDVAQLLEPNLLIRRLHRAISRMEISLRDADSLPELLMEGLEMCPVGISKKLLLGQLYWWQMISRKHTGHIQGDEVSYRRWEISEVTEYSHVSELECINESHPQGISVNYRLREILSNVPWKSSWCPLRDRTLTQTSRPWKGAVCNRRRPRRGI